MDLWAPMFAVGMGIPRSQLEAMSVPEMVDHVDYWHDLREARNGG